MTPDPRSISDVLRRIIGDVEYFRRRDLSNADTRAADIDAAKVLADRFAIEGPPRVGDLVRGDGAGRNVARGIVVEAFDTGAALVAMLDEDCRSYMYLRPSDITILARSPWSSDDLEQTR